MGIYYRGILMAMLAIGAGLCEFAQAGQWQHQESVSLHGSRGYWLYKPAKTSALIVFLHGCNESALEFAGGARVAVLAEKHDFAALLPEQSNQANPERCWNWFSPLHQFRGQGEPGWLASLTAETRDKLGIDPRNVYVVGLSAGGAMANILASCHRELFSAIAIHSGMPFRAAYDVSTAYWSLRHGGVLASELSGSLSYRCTPGSHEPLPTLLIHGTNDQRVHPINSEQLASQFANYNDHADDGLRNGSFSLREPERMAATAPGGYRYKIERHRSNGRLLIENIIVEQMGHSWSGGDPAFPHTDPKGPDFSKILVKFFQEVTHESTKHGESRH